MCVSGIMTSKRMGTTGFSSPLPPHPQTGGLGEVIPAKTHFLLSCDGVSRRCLDTACGSFSLTPYHTSSFCLPFYSFLFLSFYAPTLFTSTSSLLFLPGLTFFPPFLPSRILVFSPSQMLSPARLGELFIASLQFSSVFCASPPRPETSPGPQ